jgi:conjugal transfer/entry exclusion protein
LNALGHVFPGHSQAQMRVVGVGQRTASSAVLPTTSSSTSAAWTLVKSGNQILPVQVGQLLGIEKSKVTFTDAQGLWLAAEGGRSRHLVAWEQIKP